MTDLAKARLLTLWIMFYMFVFPLVGTVILLWVYGR